MGCHGGHKEVTQLLLRAGASVDQTSKEGFTPLSVACDGGHNKVAELLLRAGARGHQEEKVEQCSICLDPVRTDCPQFKKVKPCQHRFHLNCIQVNTELVSINFSLMVSIYIFRTGSTRVGGPAPSVGKSWD